MKIARFLAVVFALILVSGITYAAGPIVKLCIKPGHMDLRPGVQQQFSVYGLDIFDNEVPVTEQVTWSTEAGTITGSGLFTAGTLPGRYMRGIKATTPSGLSGVALVTVSDVPAAGNYYFERAWGNFIPGQTLIPNRIKMGPRNTILVADLGTYTVHQFDTSGRYVYQFGPLWSGLCSTGSTTSYGDYVYAAPDGHIIKFDANGKLVWLINGDWSDASNMFGRVGDMATDSSGNLYIIDTFKHRIEKFGPSGEWLKTWGSEGSGNGQFLDPQSICVDSAGNIYVSDPESKCIQRFSSDGTFVAKWTDYGSGYGAINGAYSITADSKGNIYVFDSTASRAYKMNSSGAVLKATDLAATGYMTVDGDGNFYISSGNTQNASIKKFNSSGELVAEWGKTRPGQLNYPITIAATNEGRIYTQRGSLIDSFDSVGNALGHWSHWTSCVRVDSLGNVYYATGYGGKVEVCNAAGDPVKEYQLPAVPGDYADASFVAIARNGDVYIADAHNVKITRMDSTGKVLNQFGSKGMGAGNFQSLGPIAVDFGGNVYAMDQTTHTIQKFWPDGKCVGTIGPLGDLMSLCVSPNDALFTAEYWGPIRKFSLDTLLQLGSWGSGGYQAGQFYPANDVAVDGEDNVYVADGLNNRVCKFAPIYEVTNRVKDYKDGAFVKLTGHVVTANTADLGDCIYVESPDRSSGIRVTGVTSMRGITLNITGNLTTVDGERTLKATTVNSLNVAPLQPVALTNKALGGADLNFDPTTGKGQRGVEDGSGANNIGLLVITTGRVTGVGKDFFYIDDGTHAHDGSIFVGVRVRSRNLTKPKVGDHVTVTGISRINKIGDRYFRSISARLQSDIVIAQ